jgi:hypothetical protein
MDFLLMNGHRAREEWPAIRRAIPSKSMTIHRLKPLPEPGGHAHADLIEDLHLGGPPPQEVEADERLVYELSLPGIAVRTVIDRAPLSRFQTMSALASLIKSGYVRLS